MVLTMGDALRPDNPSDHVPVSARFSRRRARHPSMQPPLAASLCRSEAFAREVVDKLRFVPSSLGPFAQISCFKAVIREAAGVAARRLAEQRSLPSAVLAQTALGVLRASRRGDARGVARGVQANRDLVSFVDGRSRRSSTRRASWTTFARRPSRPRRRNLGTSRSLRRQRRRSASVLRPLGREGLHGACGALARGAWD